jgi:CheY-like chemotaxis protein
MESQTYFAPAGRVSQEELNQQTLITISHPLTTLILEAVSGYVLILNQQRQVLAVNKELLEALHLDPSDLFTGLRPGEILNCQHVSEGPDGCGTSPHCKYCGAVLSILMCQSIQEPAINECRLTQNKNGQIVAADFKVKATPLKIGEQVLTVFILQDISASKRREILEKVFLHDFFNTVGGIQGWSEQLNLANPELAAHQIMFLSSLLKEEIRFHSLLLQAEKDELETSDKPVSPDEIINHLNNIFVNQHITHDKHLEAIVPSNSGCFTTDSSLLLRILTNMVKNALEETGAGGTVTVHFEWEAGCPAFRVHNQAFIPETVQEHIFERSFTTKGEGRGIGTYSMKLFGEHYLKGLVGFVSTPQGGTTFSITLPKQEAVQPQNQEDKQSTQPEASHIMNNADNEKQVILVEDDESHALLGRLLLEKLGFQVHVCENGEDAVSLFSGSPEAFYFVMTDYTMSPINGLETARRLLEINPSTSVLLCTGRDDPTLSREARAAGVRAVALKPSNREEMEDLLVSAGLYRYED